MSVQIFVEGGGDQPTTRAKCRKGFSDYCRKVAPLRHNPSIVACGGRDEAFKKFCTAISNSREGETFALLVDAEDAVVAASCVEHLAKRDPSWQFPELKHHQVFLMTRTMEAWFISDRELLANFYNGGYLPNALPPNPLVESISKLDLERAFKNATRKTNTKGEYHKTRHGFELLGRLDPEKVEAASPHAADFHKFLRSL